MGNKIPPSIPSTPGCSTIGPTHFLTKPRIQSTDIKIGHQRNPIADQNELFIVVVTAFFPLLFFVILILPLLLSYPYSYPLHFLSSSCATIHYSLAQLFFRTLLIHSLSLSSPPPPSLVQLLPPTHSPHTDSLLYQPYTTPALCNTWHKYPPPQQQKYTQIDTSHPKFSIPHTSSPTRPTPLFPFCLLVPPLPITKVYISN
jgi:hypothetical protein